MSGENTRTTLSGFAPHHSQSGDRTGSLVFRSGSPSWPSQITLAIARTPPP